MVSLRKSEKPSNSLRTNLKKWYLLAFTYVQGEVLGETLYEYLLILQEDERQLAAKEKKRKKSKRS